jgi:hypothetical protein
MPLRSHFWLIMHPAAEDCPHPSRVIQTRHMARRLTAPEAVEPLVSDSSS